MIYDSEREGKAQCVYIAVWQGEYARSSSRCTCMHIHITPVPRNVRPTFVPTPSERLKKDWKFNLRPSQICSPFCKLPKTPLQSLGPDHSCTIQDLGREIIYSWESNPSSKTGKQSGKWQWGCKRSILQRLQRYAQRHAGECSHI